MPFKIIALGCLNLSAGLVHPAKRRFRQVRNGRTGERVWIAANPTSDKVLLSNMGFGYKDEEGQTKSNSEATLT